MLLFTIITAIVCFFILWRVTSPNVFQRLPKVGDRVRVTVGFSSYKQEGIVSSVHKDYCWIDQYDNKGNFIRGFTASFSYCHFEYLKKK